MSDEFDDLQELLKELAHRGTPLGTEDTPDPPPAPKRGGPRTPRGRAASAQNAVTHGVNAKTPVIPRLGETPEEWTQFEAGVVTSLAPVGELEAELSRRVALLLWRLRRAARAETATVARQLARTSFSDVPAELLDASRGAPFEDESHLLRYETTLNRLLTSALTSLELIQRRRVGERPAVARLEIADG